MYITEKYDVNVPQEWIYNLLFSNELFLISVYDCKLDQKICSSLLESFVVFSKKRCIYRFYYE